jgi:hypothetical protein
MSLHTSTNPSSLKTTIHGAVNASAETTKPVRAATVLPTDPFHLTPYAQELMTRRVMLAPVLVTWQYNVASHKRFTGWLSTREILMSDIRLGADWALRDIRYCGTYRAETDQSNPSEIVGDDSRDTGGTYRTMWGYASEAAMLTVQRLATNPNGPTTIIQNDLIEFIATIKRCVAEAGDQHFSQQVMMGAAAG